MIKVISGAIGVVLGFVIFCLVVAIPVMLLWDWLMPKIFGLPEITLLQALGLMVLSGILFKGGVSTSQN
jgi:hypothetical protein